MTDIIVNPGDMVLVRAKDPQGVWKLFQYSHFDERSNGHFFVGGLWLNASEFEVVPYKKNEVFLGKSFGETSMKVPDHYFAVVNDEEPKRIVLRPSSEKDTLIQDLKRDISDWKEIARGYAQMMGYMTTEHEGKLYEERNRGKE